MTKKRKSRKPKNETHKDTPKRREVKLDELEAILARTQQGALTDEDHEKLKAAIDTLAYLTTELETKGASIRRLRKLIFGSSTEKTSKLFDEKTEKESSSDNATEATSSAVSRPQALAPTRAVAMKKTPLRNRAPDKKRTTKTRSERAMVVAAPRPIPALRRLPLLTKHSATGTPAPSASRASSTAWPSRRSWCE